MRFAYIAERFRKRNTDVSSATSFTYLSQGCKSLHHHQNEVHANRLCAFLSSVRLGCGRKAHRTKREISAGKRRPRIPLPTLPFKRKFLTPLAQASSLNLTVATVSLSTLAWSRIMGFKFNFGPGKKNFVNAKSTMYAYGVNGEYIWPGKTFEVKKGVHYEVTWRNNIDAGSYISTGHGDYCEQSVVDTSLHWAYSLFEEENHPLSKVRVFP